MPEQMLSLDRFAQRLQIGHPDRIWLGPLRALHRHEKRTLSGWQALIDKLRKQPAK